jgi:hypothetical protein
MVEKTAEADMRYSSQCTFSAAWERVRLNRPDTARHSTQKPQNSQNNTGLLCGFREFCVDRPWASQLSFALDSASSTLRTLRAKLSGVNGFCRNAEPGVRWVCMID